MKAKKILAVILAAAMLLGVSGCGKAGGTAGVGKNISSEAKQAIKDGKTVIVLSQWPAKDSPDYEKSEEKRAKFMEQNPDIFIEPSQFKFDFKTFTAVAASGELPTMYDTYFTQVKSIIDNGFATDITENLKKIGFYDKISEKLLPYTTDNNGNVYALTYKAYYQGLHINKNIFKEAGLVDENGNVLVPSSYEDVYEFSKTIKEKTGKAGFAFPTAENVGGWHFVNLAWAYGVEFLKKDGDKYIAAFDTQECYDAFEWIRKMKKDEQFFTKYRTLVNKLNMQVFYQKILQQLKSQ